MSLSAPVLPPKPPTPALLVRERIPSFLVQRASSPFSTSLLLSALTMTHTGEKKKGRETAEGNLVTCKSQEGEYCGEDQQTQTGTVRSHGLPLRVDALAANLELGGG